MAFEKPHTSGPESEEVILPPGNLEPVEGDILEAQEGEREVGEMVAEFTVGEDDMVDEIESLVEDTPERGGILRRIHAKAKGFVAAGIAAGAIVGFSGTFNDAEAATRSRKAQVISRIATAGRSIYTEVERENQRKGRREYGEVRREISRLEGEIRKIDRQIERLPQETERKETKALGESEKNIDRASDLRRKAEKARKVGQITIAESYEKLATRYESEAGEDMEVQGDATADIATLRERKTILERELTALEQERDRLEGKVDSSRMRERIVRRIPTRF